jgi:uncharacterized protein (TIRG00374 family)
LLLKLSNVENILKSLNPRKILWPILIGLAVSGFLLYRTFDKETFTFVTFTWHTLLFLAIAAFMMIVRDVAYMYRVIVLTDYQIGWKQAFNIIMLWEFSSAISPSVVGGTAPAIFFLYKEGVSSGKRPAVILTAIFLDELFFIVAVPIVYFIFGNYIFPPDAVAIEEIKWSFLIGYVGILVYTLFLSYALFINPYLFKSFISWVFLFPLLRKWRLRARKSANQLIKTSREIKGKPFMYWFKSMIATIFSWGGRYFVVNFMLMAFFGNIYSLKDHLLIFGRQLTMWIILLVSPTPGGSGIAEYIFSNFLGDFIANPSWYAPLAILWRIISYYPYLFIGVIILPVWLRKVFKTPHYKEIK